MKNPVYELNYIPILTVFISGIFGLIVALLTWRLANQREKRKFNQEILIRDLKDKENLYVETIATLDKTIRMTERGSKFDDTINEFSLMTSKMSLLGTEKINQNLNNVGDLIHKWSSEYNKSQPKDVGDTGFVIRTSNDNKHRVKANEIYPDLMTSMDELVTEIKNELKKMKSEITCS